MKCGPKLATNAPKKKKQAASRHDRRKDELRYRWSNFKSQARRRGISASLTLVEYLAVTSQKCSYCGGRTGSSPFNGIDRVDNNAGYYLQNAVPCCKACNFMKGCQAKQEFLSQVRAIYLHTLAGN
jgi:hypothetical protein